jgi:hypothetical protein
MNWSKPIPFNLHDPNLHIFVNRIADIIKTFYAINVKNLNSFGLAVRAMFY